MYRNIFETHAHYDEACYAGRLPQVLNAQREAGVTHIINASSSIPSAKRAVALARAYDFVYAAVGVYPLEAAAAPGGWLQEVERLAGAEKVACIGEIGLDYHEPAAERAAQRRVFCAQLALAGRLGMPVQIHSRDADADMLAILREYRPARAVIHRFSSPPDYGAAFLSLGCCLSFCCAVTYPEWAFLLETARAMPLEQMVLETDAPFLAPAHLAGQTATSEMIAFVAARIASVRPGCSPQDILDVTCENAQRLFDIP